MFEMKGKYTSAKVMIDNVEASCVSQIQGFLNHPAFTNPVAIMPDCHAGNGSCIGFTMPMTDKVIANVVGVDVGCGMKAIKLDSLFTKIFDDPEFLRELDHEVRQRVPMGFDTHDRSILDMKKEFPWHKANVLAHKFTLAYGEKFGASMSPPHYDFDWFEQKCKAIGCDLGRAIKSLGTLGGGNHFIEAGLSPTGHIWITVHTGSRNFGKCICEYWQDLAVKKVTRQSKEEHRAALAELKATYKGKELYDKIKAMKAAPSISTDPFPCADELRWLEGEDAQGYLYDMILAQVYAQVNRDLICKVILEDILDVSAADSIETVHNFIDFNDFIIRKGAIRSYVGERFILPFNMRDGLLICEGKSNPDWNYSAPHGAGRVLKRGQAKRTLKVEDFQRQMEGIFSTSVGAGTLDEAPDAYKDAKVIEAAIEPTAVILDRVKPVMNLKAFDTKE